MTKNIEGKFNKMAEADEGGSDNAAPAENTRAMRRELSRGKIVNYAQAVQGANAGDERLIELKKKMEAIIAPFEEAPEDPDVVRAFGRKPMEELEKVSLQSIEVQKKFDSSVNVMGTVMDKFRNDMKEKGYMSLAEKAAEAAKSLAGVGVKTSKGLFKFTKDIIDGVTGAKAKRTEDQKLIAEMSDTVPQMAKDLIKMLDEIERTGKELVKVREGVRVLGEAQAKAVREMTITLGCTEEIMRRYNEVYIPEASAAFDETGDEFDRKNLEEIMTNMERFIRRSERVHQSRVSAMTVTGRIKILDDTINLQMEKVDDILHNGKSDMISMLAAAGFSASVHKSSQNMKRSDELGDEIFTKGGQMTEQALEMALDSISRGSVDNEKLIEGMNRINTMVERHRDALKDQLEKSVQNMKDLEAAVDTYLDRAGDEKDNLILEASQKAEKARQQAENGETPATNDNSEQTPVKSAAAARRRNRGGPGR